MSYIDYIILGIVAVCFALAIYFWLFKRRKGGSCCSSCVCCNECKMRSQKCADKTKNNY